MKILCIGDTHGLDVIDEVRELEPKFDKIVFTGDYVDSFDETTEDIISRLLYTIQFKKDFPEKVELLLGNHDIQYYFFHMKDIFRLLKCTGYRETYVFKLNEIFQEQKKMFKAAYLYDNFLFTHAGISANFYLREFKDMEVRIPGHLELSDLDEKINFMFEFPYRYTELLNVGYVRGGDAGSNGGPFWADMSETRGDLLTGYHQIVGHSHRSTFNQTYDILFKSSSISYIDILPGVLEDDSRLVNNKFFSVDTENYHEQLE